MAAVDIIIPTRDRPELTIRAIQSVIDQTYADWRLLVVDDGSLLANLELLENAAQLDSRVEIVTRLQSGGGPAARQTGLEASDADWIAILDSDDRWLPSKLERQMERRHMFDIVLCWFSLVEADGGVRVTRKLMGEGYVSPTLTNNHDIPLIRRSTLARAGGFVADIATPMRYDDNTDFFIRLLSCGRVTIVPEVLVLCSDHKGARDSDGVSCEAESLRSVVESRSAQLAMWPDARSELFARVSARYVARGELAIAWGWFVRSLMIGGWRQRWGSFRKVAPFTAKRSACLIRTKFTSVWKSAGGQESG